MTDDERKIEWNKNVEVVGNRLLESKQYKLPSSVCACQNLSKFMTEAEIMLFRVFDRATPLLMFPRIWR